MTELFYRRSLHTSPPEAQSRQPHLFNQKTGIHFSACSPFNLGFYGCFAGPAFAVKLQRPNTHNDAGSDNILHAIHSASLSCSHTHIYAHVRAYKAADLQMRLEHLKYSAGRLLMEEYLL